MILPGRLEAVDGQVIHSESVREEHPQEGLVSDHLLDYQGEHYRHVHYELKHEVPGEHRE